MDGVLILFVALSAAQGVLFIALSLVMLRRNQKEGDLALARFGIAKGCLSLAQAALFLWLLLENGGDWTLPVAFVVFVGGNWALSRLARRRRAEARPMHDSDLETPPIL